MALFDRLPIRTLALLLLMAGLFNNNLTAQTCSSSDPTSPVGIVPTTFSGNNPDDCVRLDEGLGDGAEEIVFNLDGIPGNDITITVTVGTCGEVMSWSVPDNIVIDQIIAKGGTAYNVYDYTGENPRPSSDGNLHSPVNASGKYAGFSHMDFCFHYRLSASKTANTEFTRTYTWTIDKSCDGDAELTLSEGQVYNYPFSWTVDATPHDTDFKVTGTITVANNTPFDAEITDISDVLSGGEVADVDCDAVFPITLAAGESLECTYSVNLDAPYDGTNTVTVTTSTPNVEGDEASADFWFENPTTIVDGCITVTDDCTDGSTEVCYDNELPYTAEYSCPISYDVCGDYTYTNTASFTTSNTETTGSDNCTVEVNVPCGGGCTHTIGYWKTHSKYGPAPYDDTWALLLPNGEDNTFFLSGKTWYQAAWTPPAGNAYYILAHQYIAAQLNFLDGASAPAAVQTAFNTATMLFNTYTPAQIAALPGNNSVRKQFVNLAKILDDYNNGITGPGHCSEESNGGARSRGNEPATNDGFYLYPNPAGNEVQIALSDFMEQPAELTLYNQLGVVVLHRRIERVDSPIYTLHFDKGLPSGIYNLTLTTADKRLNKPLVVNK